MQLRGCSLLHLGEPRAALSRAASQVLTVGDPIMSVLEDDYVAFDGSVRSGGDRCCYWVSCC
ncbi:hypothetical protein EON64_17590 [archaeon]|nr:MAG: hypothetical protein EON64_17590 [archaeon]